MELLAHTGYQQQAILLPRTEQPGIALCRVMAFHAHRNTKQLLDFTHMVQDILHGTRLLSCSIG